VLFPSLAAACLLLGRSALFPEKLVFILNTCPVKPSVVVSKVRLATTLERP